MGSGLIAQLGLALLVIGFIVALVYSAKRWRALDVAAMLFVFFSALVFTFYAAATLKTHDFWRTKVNKLQAELDTELHDQELLEFGDLSEVVQTSDSLVSQQLALRNIILDRGRVWRNCTLGGAQGEQLSIVIPARTADADAPAANADDDAAPDAAAVPTHRIGVKSTLYAFKTLPAINGGTPPMFYLGKFFVGAVSNNSVTMAPLLPPDPIQINQINSPQGSWTLYEVMPVDANYKYSHLNRAEIEALFPADVMGVSAEVRDRMLDEFLRDGKPAQEDDPPERIWINVEFVQKYTMAVDVGGGEATELTTQNFDSSGRALANKLRQGAETTFEVGDVALFQSVVAEQLIAQGVAKRGEAIYVRKLRDYDFLFTNIAYRMQLLSDGIQLVEEDTKRLNDAIAKAQTQIAYREEERTKLAADLEKFQEEVAAIKSYQGVLAEAYASITANTRDLYASNNRLDAELIEIERRLTEEINTRTVRAGAGE